MIRKLLDALDIKRPKLKRSEHTDLIPEHYPDERTIELIVCQNCGNDTWVLLDDPACADPRCGDCGQRGVEAGMAVRES